MNRLIVVLALALTGTGCTIYPPNGHVGYGAVYESYGYGYPGYVAYPVYEYGYSYPIHRYGDRRDDDHWGDRHEIHRDSGRPGYEHDHDDWRRHGESSLNAPRWHSSSREPDRARTSWPRPAPDRPDFQHGMTRPRGLHQDAR